MSTYGKLTANIASGGDIDVFIGAGTQAFSLGLATFCPYVENVGVFTLPAGLKIVS